MVALAATACGGSSHDAATTTVPAPTTTVAPRAAAVAPLSPYVRRMRLVGATLGKAVDGLYPLDSGTPGSDVSKQSVARIERARRVVVHVRTQLAAIHPPAKVAADHRKLQAALTTLVGQMDKLAASLRTGDTDTFNELSQLPALQLVSAATDAMVKRGYDVVGS